MTNTALHGGFDRPSVQSAHAFRAILDVMARPGTIAEISGATPPAPMSAAAGTVILTLCDTTTPIYLAGAHDCAELREWITFHCGAPIVSAEQAVFALGDWNSLHPCSRFTVGLPDYPDRAATLIVEMAQLHSSGVALRGPGIETVAHLNLPETKAFAANAAQFPLGFDCLFTAGAQIAGLPRSTKVETI